MSESELDALVAELSAGFPKGTPTVREIRAADAITTLRAELRAAQQRDQGSGDALDDSWTQAGEYWLPDIDAVWLRFFGHGRLAPGLNFGNRGGEINRAYELLRAELKKEREDAHSKLDAEAAYLQWARTGPRNSCITGMMVLDPHAAFLAGVAARSAS